MNVAFYSDLAPYIGNLALFIDQEGRPLDAHISSPVIFLLDPDAIGLTGFTVSIGHELERQVVLRLEVIVALHAVLRDADDLCRCP